jgi:hypothetical protein
VCTEERKEGKGRGHGGDAGSQDRARGGVGIESARQLALAVAWNRRTAVAAATFAGGPEHGGGQTANVRGCCSHGR